MSCVLSLFAFSYLHLVSLSEHGQNFEWLMLREIAVVVDKAMQGVKPLSWQALNGGIPSEGWY